MNAGIPRYFHVCTAANGIDQSDVGLYAVNASRGSNPLTRVEDVM